MKSLLLGLPTLTLVVSLCVVLSTLGVVSAFQGASETLEPLEDYRRRLGIEFNYTPKGVHPEICRYINQTECEELDTFTRDLQENLEARGKIRVIVLLVQTNDNFPTPPREDYDALFNSDTINDDINPTGSVKEYFFQNSLGRLEVEFTVTDWVRSASPESVCVGNTRGIGQTMVDCFKPALEALDDRHFDANDPFDYADYDANFDFSIDPIIVLHNGFDYTEAGEDPAGTPSQNRIQPHAAGSPTGFRSRSGYRMNLYCVTGAFRGNGQDGFNLLRLNVVSHEYIHTFGMIDLYDLSFQGNGCGGYCIMAYAVGQSNSKILPGNVGAYTRDFLDWGNPIEITSDGTFSLEPSFSTGNYYRLRSPNHDPNEYFLIENRQPQGFDLNFWGGGGIVIWHVNENDNLNNEANGLERVRIVQADGDNDLEAKRNLGDDGDLWVGGDQEANDEGIPNLRSMVNGNPSGIRIFNFSPSQEVAEFTIAGLGGGDPTAAPQPSPTSQPVPDPTPAPQPEATPQPQPDPTVAPQTDNPVEDQPVDNEPTPDEQTPAEPTPDAPSPGTPTDTEPTPDAPTPDAPSPGTPTDTEPTPDAPTPAEPTPDAPSPGTPTDDEPTPDSPTPAEPTPDAPSPGTPTDNEPTPDAPSPGTPTDEEPTPGASEPSPGVPTPDAQTPTTQSPDSLTPAEPSSGEPMAQEPSSGAPVSLPSDELPTFDLGQCTFSVGTDLCGTLLPDIDPEEDCDCYNFCDGEYLGCCAYGEGCPVACDGSVTGGCIFASPSEAPSINPSTNPSTEVSQSPSNSGPTDSCVVSASESACANLMPTVVVADSCDCYNFCNGQQLPCCPFGAMCPPLTCDGDFVAGCVVDDRGPTSSPIPQPACFIQVNTFDCLFQGLSTNQEPIPDCDCYDYCDGEFAGCCPYNTFCGLQCGPSVTEVAAGCQLRRNPTEPTPVPVSDPTSAPVSDNRASPFFFWPEGFTAPKYNGDEKRRLLSRKNQRHEL